MKYQQIAESDFHKKFINKFGEFKKYFCNYLILITVNAY